MSDSTAAPTDHTDRYSPNYRKYALGVLLLGIVMIMFLLYDKIVGVDNMKLG